MDEYHTRLLLFNYDKQSLIKTLQIHCGSLNNGKSIAYVIKVDGENN